MIPGSLAQAVGQIFDTNAYPVTSNGGEILLLVAVTLTAYLIQNDLLMAGSFATFLHRSNIAFARQGSGGVADRVPPTVPEDMPAPFIPPSPVDLRSPEYNQSKDKAVVNIVPLFQQQIQRTEVSTAP